MASFSQFGLFHAHIGVLLQAKIMWWCKKKLANFRYDDLNSGPTSTWSSPRFSPSSSCWFSISTSSTTSGTSRCYWIFPKTTMSSKTRFPGPEVWLEEEAEEGVELVLDSSQHRRHLPHPTHAQDHCWHVKMLLGKITKCSILTLQVWVHHVRGGTGKSQV